MRQRIASLLHLSLLRGRIILNADKRLSSPMIPTNINRRDSYTRTYSGSQPLSQHFVEERRQWLRTNGAVQGAHGPVKIQAERIAFSHTSDDEASIRSDDHEGKNFKIIHFQRHGQGYHNLLYRIMQENDRAVTDIYGSDPVANPFVRPEIVDSPLTELGRAQCAEQRQAVVAEYDLTPQLVIVSPLHRALQTAQITFQDSLDAAIPFVAHEACREELGILTCNKRRPLSETKREFPNIDFSLLESGEEDTLWNPLEREAAHDQSKRIYDFLVDFVQHQPQREIAVVGHSAWLFTMCNAVIDCGDDDDLISWFGTAEIRTVKMTWGGDDP